MKLAKGEYTTSGFLEFLKSEYKKKVNGKEFTSNDIAQYLLRGYTPYRYGGLKISSLLEEGVRIIKVK
jgi:hypothetical protein